MSVLAPSETYGEDYYLRGKQMGLSNYEDYRWLPGQTCKHAAHLMRYLKIREGQTVLDVGCSRGYLVKALRWSGIEAYGYDISRWAIENCDEEVKEWVSNELKAEPKQYDWITLKDVCEHIEPSELAPLLEKLSAAAKRGLFIVVPLTIFMGGNYIRPEDEADVTHVNRWPLDFWMQYLMHHCPGFTVSVSYYIKGIKECCADHPGGCGFFTITRI